MLTIQLSEHAVERFQHRVRPALDVDAASDALAALILFGEVVDTPPPWHAGNCAQLAPFYLVAGDVLLPLKEHWSEPDVLVATTCFVRGVRSDDVRRRVRARRRTRRGRLTEVA